jgi:hypothetical protein
MIETLKSNRPRAFVYVSAGAGEGGDGSRRRPFASINSAIAGAKPCTAILVLAGDYREHVRFPREINGLPGCPIWLLSADGPHKARVVAPNVNLPAIGGGGNENIVVEGFATVGGRNGIHFGMNGTDYADLARNIVLRFNSVESPAMDAIKVNGAEGIYIADNTLVGAPNEAIDFVAVVQAAVMHNTIRDMQTSSGAIILKGGSSNILVEGNAISDISANGIAVGGWTSREMHYRNGFDTFEAERVTVTGNRVERVRKSPLVFMGAHDCKAYDNALDGGTTFPAVWIGGNRPDAAKPFRSERLHVTDNRISGSRRQVETKPDSGPVEFVRNDRQDWSEKAGADLSGYALPPVPDLAPR